MKELVQKTKAVNKKFSQKWSSQIRFIDLAEEVGELANALLGEYNAKPSNRIKSEIEDSLCDILYDLILLADDFNLDLNTSYQKMLERLEERIKAGEFEGK